MKKIITLLLMALCLVGVDASAQVAKIMLKNGSTSSFYNADQLATAVENAVDGDTIIFTEGYFTGGVTIDKKISLIGAGQNTIITKGLSLRLAGNPSLTSRFADALQISGEISILLSVKDLMLRKVNFDSFAITNGCTIENLILDRCKLDTFGGSEKYYKNANAINSCFVDVSMDCKQTNFLNCYINRVAFKSSFCGTVINSIIRTKSGNYSIQSGCSLTNCLIGSEINVNNAFVENCYFLSAAEISSIYWDQEALLNGGYLGNDGTVVGYTGGTTPYTLVPNGPQITSMELKVDTDNNQLKVTVTGTAK